MGYRVKTQRGLQRVVPEEGLGAVRRAIRERNDGVALAMSFDPGTVSDLALYAHASAIMMGLLYARGWRRAQPLTAGGVPRQRGDGPISCSRPTPAGSSSTTSPLRARAPNGPPRRLGPRASSPPMSLRFAHRGWNARGAGFTFP